MNEQLEQKLTTLLEEIIRLKEENRQLLAQLEEESGVKKSRVKPKEKKETSEENQPSLF